MLKVKLETVQSISRVFESVTNLHEISPPLASLDGHFEHLGGKNNRVCIDQY